MNDLTPIISPDRIRLCSRIARMRPNLHESSAEICVWYSVRPSASGWSTYYSTLLNWIENHGFLPHQLAIDGGEWGGKPRSFKNAHPKLLVQGFDKIKNLEIRCKSNDDPLLYSEWNLIANICSARKYVAIVLARDSKSLLIYPPDQLLNLVSETLRPDYGIGLRRSFKKSPLSYVVGGTSLGSGETYPERGEVAKWSNDYDLQKSKILRGVYPMSYLTGKRLSQPVGELTLMDWINASENRGRLTQLSNGYAWHVQEADIPRVRDELNSAGLLYQLPPEPPEPPPLPPEDQAKVDAIREELYRNIGVTPERRT